MRESVDRSIILNGVTVGPLEGVDLEIPLGRLVCFVGRQGSGCRTLGADVLYPESRRRYMLTLSPFERESLGGPGGVVVEGVSGLPPALFYDGLERRPRETVGAYLQVDQAVALLLHQRGEVACLECGGVCRSYSVEEAAEEVLRVLGEERALLLAPLSRGEDTPWPSVLEELQKAGFLRIRHGGKVMRLDEGGIPGGRIPEETRLEVVIDRLARGAGRTSRIIEAIHNARAISGGRTLLVGSDTGEETVLNQQLTCGRCGTSCGDLVPEDFSGSGKGRKTQARQVSIDGLGLGDLEHMDLGNMARFLRRIDDPGNRVAAAITSLEEGCSLGLEHIALSRSTGQLSTGEWQRLLLANCLSSRMTGILYIFSAPTAGLHGRDILPCIQGLRQLVDRGNTVVAVDHAPSLLMEADEVIAFEEGRARRSKGYGLKRMSGSPIRKKPGRAGPEIWIRGDAIMNLASIDLHIPLQRLVGVTGPSGSGKTTLLNEVVAPVLRDRSVRAGRGRRRIMLQGGDGVRRVTQISGERAGKGKLLLEELQLFDYLGKLFAATPAARQRNCPSEWFQLDRPGGRCTACEGRGVLRYDLHFLEDVSLPCPTCGGRRYRPEMLEITRNGLNIADVLDLSVEQGRRHFHREGPVVSRLAAAQSCGLGSCLLGNSSTQLERGEFLRLQLSVELARASPSELILLDHPAGGDHPGDLEQIVRALDAVVAKGASVLMEENRHELLAEADWLIALERESGGRGMGRIVAAGTPEDLLVGQEPVPSPRRSSRGDGEFPLGQG